MREATCEASLDVASLIRASISRRARISRIDYDQWTVAAWRKVCRND